MNPELRKLQPYPFERLAALFNGVTPPESVRTIALHIGEPAHPAPQTVVDTLWAHRDGFSKYPKTAGEPWLRDAMAAWLRRRYGRVCDSRLAFVATQCNAASTDTVQHILIALDGEFLI
jgi:N-succinyldiaminopimelate aminotransferase